ncbi:hypothetical protein GYMLUDRAFT_246940 [Collybiopsis luxurians FD-317 M1]|uniref:FAD-binding domain-containing protein n=1 Tax=Collybiopsis luxurians FD-317 M1 TaxID=944289 RepID=A0A0D0B321_9AGAR|nr:hypothetical protein GYMLUDRAFT_246940 [Collybiopsis luxurians FD-317 M1]
MSTSLPQFGCCISLISQGIESRRLTIVDSSERSSDGSRATNVHAATLESLELGCASRMVELGIKGVKWSFGDNTSRLICTDFVYNSAHTRFPFVLVIPRIITENAPEDRLQGLGIRVLRPCRGIGMKVILDGEGTDVLFESGETIRARYVIGADGPRSSTTFGNQLS